MQALKMNQKLN